MPAENRKVDQSAVPSVLKDRGQWVVWWYDARNDETKMPYTPGCPLPLRPGLTLAACGGGCGASGRGGCRTAKKILHRVLNKLRKPVSSSGRT